VNWQTPIYRKRFAFALVCAEQRHFRVDFMAWLSENWHVWQEFEAQADRVWARGRRHYSARTIFEVLRHESVVKEAGNAEGWKLNNNVVPDLARLYGLMHPDRVDFFEKRVGPLSARAA
jgi:hypothetical protein